MYDTEKELLAKAELVDWNGYPIATLDHFYTSWEDMAESAQYEEWKKIPEYVFATKRCTIPHLDAGDIVERIMEELDIDNGDEPTIHGVDELQKALDAFREANKNINWFEIDIKRKVKVPQSVIDEIENGDR